jgi:hypothetical protein
MAIATLPGALLIDDRVHQLRRPRAFGGGESPLKLSLASFGRWLRIRVIVDYKQLSFAGSLGASWVEDSAELLLLLLT